MTLGPATGPDTDSSVLDARGPDGPGLRVRFFWQEDRYGHEIAVVDGDNISTLLVTQPVSAEAHWPDNPPLQQIGWLEAASLRRVALLIGMAGRSHWSLSVEAGKDVAELAVDVACRLQQPPKWLGNTYRCLHVFDGQSPREARFRVGAAVGAVVAESLGEDQPVAIEVSGGHLSIAPGLDRINAPTTVRWMYRVRLDPPSNRI